eukprot:3202371-Pyramimonas_sp.AAC.1
MARGCCRTSSAWTISWLVRRSWQSTGRPRSRSPPPAPSSTTRWRPRALVHRRWELSPRG